VLELECEERLRPEVSSPEALLRALADLLLEALRRQDNQKSAAGASMNPKITPDHLGRGAVVYVRQSTVGQVIENTESQRRKYALAVSARALGFASAAVIDDDLGRHFCH
jgi:hypothetical protein